MGADAEYLQGRMSSGDVIALTSGLGICGVVGWLWSTRDRRSDAELGAVIFSDDVHVKARRRPGDRFGSFHTPSGWVRLFVRENTIAIRWLGAPRWLGALLLMDYTLDGADCEVGVAEVRDNLALSRAERTGAEYVILRGWDSRGWLELAMRSRITSVEDLKRELVRAGVRPSCVLDEAS